MTLTFLVTSLVIVAAPRSWPPLEYAGVAYLLWMAWHTWRDRSPVVVVRRLRQPFAASFVGLSAELVATSR